jgi:cytochrome bd-type quinol oxidase subunit 2
MLSSPLPPKSLPIFFYLMCVVTGALYLAMLASAVHTDGGGEASIANAFQSLFTVLGLWIALAILLLIAGVMGEMPRWAAIVWVPLHLFSGVAVTIAIDMVSRHLGWAIMFPALLPLLIFFYALWTRLPGFHARFAAGRTNVLTIGAILALSVAPSILAIYW